MNQMISASPVAARAGDRAKVFVSYSRKDMSFAQMLVGALAARGFDAFLDKTDIAPGEPWKERLATLIATADTVVVVVSPDSAASTICGWELDESATLGLSADKGLVFVRFRVPASLSLEVFLQLFGSPQVHR